MPVPKQKKSKSATRQKRNHHALKTTDLSKCPKCGSPSRSHFACTNCGTYNKREVIDVMAKLSKTEKKEKEQEQKATEKRKLKEDNSLTTNK